MQRKMASIISVENTGMNLYIGLNVMKWAYITQVIFLIYLTQVVSNIAHSVLLALG